MKRLYSLLIATSAFILGGCSQDLPEVPQKNQQTIEEPEEPEVPDQPDQPEALDFAGFKILLEKLNLQDPYLYKVKAALNVQDTAQAMTELLNHFRTRSTVFHTRDDQQPAAGSVPSPENIRQNNTGKSIAEGVLKQADDALNHLFLAHKSFAPIDYGSDIDWAKPHSDKEVLYQVHRMYWWIPMGQAYWSTQQEKYAKEWIYELKDWIQKNPCDPQSATFKYAWRPLEIATRIGDQTVLLNYFVTAADFTPNVLVAFLNNYWAQCDYLKNNFPYENGNHLLFSGNGIYTAGCFFPEFKDAATWRNDGVGLLQDQLFKPVTSNDDVNSGQVYEDGVQYEYAPKYQAAAISEFMQAMEFAIKNSRGTDFPQEYKDKVRRMIDVLINTSMCVPNANNKPSFDLPMFGDTPHIGSGFNKYFTTWMKSFPDDRVLEYFSKNGGSGTAPDYTCAAHEQGGFYTLRDGWNGKAMMMAITAHPEQVWHSHPDVGTFELSVYGRLFMPDAGFYKYEGDAQTNQDRNKFRRSSIHKIMTLNNANIKVSNVKQLRWDISGTDKVLSIENQAYADMKVVRTIYFHSKAPKCYIIVDEGIGDATGQVDVHFNMLENANITYDEGKKQMYTGFEDDNNLLLQSFCQANDFTLKKVQGEDALISYEYGKTVQGKAVAFQTQKTDGNPVQVVSVLIPFKNKAELPELELTHLSGSAATGDLQVNLNINGTAVQLQ